MYDSLSYVKELEAAGIPRHQAEVQVEIMSRIVDSNFATKQDLKDLASDIRLEINTVRLEIKESTNAHGKMLVVAVTVLIAAIGLIVKL